MYKDFRSTLFSVKVEGRSREMMMNGLECLHHQGFVTASLLY